MFSFRRPENRATVDWQAVHRLLSDAESDPAVEQTFPRQQRLSFLEALSEIDPAAAARVTATGRRLERATKLAEYPLLAIAGMLNSGKTSLVAGFLSGPGRRRTLRGLFTREGTHRFVLWLPAVWKEDAELWGALLEQLCDALGAMPEMLADDPEVAHAQYNNAGADAAAVSVPLLATDPSLDSLGFGLLDCPDIVTDATYERGTPAERIELLQRATTLCSAFLLVTTHESLRDQKVAEMLEIAQRLMPDIPRLLLLNRLSPREPPHRVLADVADLVDRHGVAEVFAAYDFEKGGHERYRPEEAGEPDDPLPVFFSVRAQEEENPPAAIDSSRLLRGLPERLDRAEMFEHLRRSLAGQLREAVWQEGIARLRRHIDQGGDQARQARQRLLDAMLEILWHRQSPTGGYELRLLHSETISAQVAEAFAAVAPWYSKPGVWLSVLARRTAGGVRRAASRMIVPQAMEQLDETRQRIRRRQTGNLLDAHELADRIRQLRGSAVLPGNPSGEALQERCQRTIDRFVAEDLTGLDQERLREAIKQMWRQMPPSKKLRSGAVSLAIVTAAFGSVLLIPFDFGATTVIGAASLQELLTAAGLSALSTLWAGRADVRELEQRAAAQQLSNLLAILCDELGVPRAAVQEETLTIERGGCRVALPEPQVGPRLTEGPSLHLWSFREPFAKELAKVLPAS